MTRKRPGILSTSRPLLLMLLLLSLAYLAGATCFYPDGSISPNDVPCSDDAPDSVCCGEGYACLSNGICQATGDELLKPDASEFVRGSCTDKAWRSSHCPLFCINPSVDLLSGGTGIFKCPDTTEDLYLCLDVSNEDALEANSCANTTNVLFFPGAPTVLTTIGVAAPAPSPTSGTSTPPPTSTTGTTSTTEQTSTIEQTSTTEPTSTPPPTSTTDTTSTASESSTTSGTSTASGASKTSGTSTGKASHTAPLSTETAGSHSNNGSNNNNNSTMATPTQAPGDSSPPAKSHTGAIIGGAVGGGLGGIAVVGIVLWLLISRRKPRAQEEQSTVPVFEVDSTGSVVMPRKSDIPIFSPAWHIGQQLPRYQQHPLCEAE